VQAVVAFSRALVSALEYGEEKKEQMADDLEVQRERMFTELAVSVGLQCVCRRAAGPTRSESDMAHERKGATMQAVGSATLCWLRGI